ncbi:hypothetical protein CYL16_18955 [Mycobacterium sp. EPG1]|nr:hypothetical protein CYL16_18955 [Mycobacterium sp. EPG1]
MPGLGHRTAHHTSLLRRRVNGVGIGGHIHREQLDGRSCRVRIGRILVVYRQIRGVIFVYRILFAHPSRAFIWAVSLGFDVALVVTIGVVGDIGAGVTFTVIIAAH